ncbi:L,D-transpeptidase family protein [Streptomyces deccanensis]|uniref:L,D-transpeptidase family protein n=1 Tax=Streptomyces deccanensis TaxID=424188 RepID=UPI001EFB188B|nr:L,D-transpeptidase family protein [Streptomyces deccanensis]ULR55795.1 L,D-transpeptidase family protein [Streptomyces deccanensis]
MRLLLSPGIRLPVSAAVLALALGLGVTVADKDATGGEPAAGAPSSPAGARDVQAVAPAPDEAAPDAKTQAEAQAQVEAQAETDADADNPSASATTDLPGLGPRTLAEIPDDARQVVVATGKGKDSSTSQVVLYQRTDDGWTAGQTWAAHNALRGWTDDHRAGDLHSPVGVFTLSDAGGLLADPGTKLPYDRSGSFTIGGTGFEGEPLAGSFDYVIAIDYNREPGTSPLDWTRPLGADRGGGIWLHVDHGGPTHGCVSLSRQHMKQLLLALDPALNPVIVMGDRPSLQR